MWEVVRKVLSFVSEGLRSNLFGFGCPVYCYQPSLASAGFFLLLDLILGIILAVLLLWQLWTFFGAPLAAPSQRGFVPASTFSRYSALAGYLDEPGPNRSRRRLDWTGCKVSRSSDLHFWACWPSHRPAATDHPSSGSTFACGKDFVTYTYRGILWFCAFCGGWGSSNFISSATWTSWDTWSDPFFFWGLPCSLFRSSSSPGWINYIRCRARQACLGCRPVGKGSGGKEGAFS